MFANKLKDIINQKNITAYHLSKLTKIPQATISRYTNGSREPNFKNVNKIAHALSISLDYFDEFDNNFVDFYSLFSNCSTINEKEIKIIVPSTFNEFKILKEKMTIKGGQNAIR